MSHQANANTPLYRTTYPRKHPIPFIETLTEQSKNTLIVIVLRVLFSALGLLAGLSVTSFPIVLFQGSVGVRLTAHTNLRATFSPAKT